MLRVGEQRTGRAGLDDAPVTHHQNAVAEIGHHAEIVGDQDDPHVHLGLQVTQQVADLGLHGHVQGGGRLVGDQQVGLAGDGPGDEHALGHAAGDLVRVGVEGALRVRDADLGEQLERPPPRLCPGQPEADAHRLYQLAANGEGGVQVGHGLLGNVGDPLAPHGAHLPRPEGRQVRALEVDGPGGYLPAGREQPQDRPRGLRLAGPGLAHQPVNLAAGDGERDILDDVLEPAAGRGVSDGEVLYVQDDVRVRQPRFVRDDHGGGGALGWPLAGCGWGRAALQFVAEAVGQQGQREQGEADCAGRPYDQQRRPVDAGEGVVEHAAPGWDAGVAQPEEFQAGLDRQGDAAHDGGLDDQRRADDGQDVPGR